MVILCKGGARSGLQHSLRLGPHFGWRDEVAMCRGVQSGFYPFMKAGWQKQKSKFRVAIQPPWGFTSSMPTYQD